MPCPHNEISIVQRSQQQSAIAAAAYQSGEKLFCEYDQQVKHYSFACPIVRHSAFSEKGVMQEVRWHLMIENNWILCPICRNKTRIKIRGDTVLENFPLYCPKCKQENLIRAYQLNIIVIKEPDAQTQSR